MKHKFFENCSNYNAFGTLYDVPNMAILTEMYKKIVLIKLNSSGLS